MRKYIAMAAITFLFSLSTAAQSQLPEIGIQKNLALGVVTEIGASKIVLKTKDGTINAILLSNTVYKRLPPDNLKLSAATPASFEDIAVGDRVLVTGEVSEDKSMISSNKMFLVKGTDLEAQAEQQRQEWRRRGISGKVVASDSAAGTISVKISSVIGADTTLTLTPKENAKFKRYSERSFRYSDAVDGVFADIEKGDNIQALGDRSEDGTTFAAEEIVTGAFVTVAGKVKSIDVEKNEVTVEDLITKKDVTIAVVDTSLLKEFPAEIAQRLARFQQMSASGAAPVRGGGSGQGRGAGRGGRRGPGDINQMLNRFPTITVRDLKAGDLIAASSSKPKVPGRVTAIKLLSGVGPFLTAKASSGGGSRRGVGGSLSVPGLDALDF